MAKDNAKNAYKDTLNLPSTAFDMRAGLLQKEPAMLEQWARDGLYARIRQARKDGPRYVLHDGPPYANGDIHMGHLLNKVLKDFVLRYRTMRGYDAPYIPGWDCHGLPIEAKVVDELGTEAARLDRLAIRTQCRQYAEHFIQVQAEQFQRLGIWGTFERPYVTMDPAYESAVLEVFARMVQQGIVYRQLKPVHWSIENRTALADAELEYYDRQDTSVYVNFALAEPEAAGKLFGLEGPVEQVMIWTTTPWTLPANRAVTVHPEFTYAAVAYTDAAGNRRVTLVAAELAGRVMALGTGEFEVLGTCTGAALAEANLHYRQPLDADRLCPIVPANYVTLEDGTGLVHTAPGHGVEDYGTALKHDLEIYCPVKGDGTYDDTVPDFLIGKSVWDANALVCAFLTESGAMFHQHRFTHSYPHDWRSKTPTIFRATEQWFVAVDRPLGDSGRTLRSLALEVAAPEGKARFVPGWGRNRLAGMLESRPDWCISRQRNWGLPIPAFRNAAGELLLTPASVRAVAEHFRQHGSDSWFTHSPAEILGDYDPTDDPDLPHKQPRTTEPRGAHAGLRDVRAAWDPDKLTQEMDIFDVWFESGSSWFAAAVDRGLVAEVPVDLYLEGSDQHRGWFQLSLLPCLATTGRPPFKTVLTHGFVVDEKGYKMSKSLGNTVNVQDELGRRGADVMRLWVSSVNYQDDIRTSDALIAQVEEAYRKIRNTLRFAMGSCFDFDPARHPATPAENSIDRWMRMELNRLIAEVTEAYENFEFHRVYRLIYEFCTVQTSSIYMAAVKDRLYCEAPDSPRRRASQSVLYQTLLALVRLMAPVLPFTCEEAWAHIPNRPADLPDSVHLAEMPAADPEVEQAYAIGSKARDDGQFYADHLQAGPDVTWERLLGLRDQGLAQLEALRSADLKNPLDAEVVFHADPQTDDYRLVEAYLPELEDMLGVGFARLAPAPGQKRVKIEVIDAREKYPRCARSWKRRPDVGSDADYPDLSARDAAAIKAIRRP